MSLVTFGSLAPALVGGIAAVAGKVSYGAAEAGIRASQGLPVESFPSDSVAQWVWPVAIGVSVGLVVGFAPKWAGALLAGSAAGALAEALRRRALP